MKKIVCLLLAICLMGAALTGCRQADRVSHNISRQADNFNVVRKITVLNVRTDNILLEMTGTISIQNVGNDLDILCMVGHNQYKKHFVSLNQWTTYVVEDISGANVDPYHYEITIYPRMFPGVSVDVK